MQGGCPFLGGSTVISINTQQQSSMVHNKVICTVYPSNQWTFHLTTNTFIDNAHTVMITVMITHTEVTCLWVLGITYSAILRILFDSSALTMDLLVPTLLASVRITSAASLL